MSKLQQRFRELIEGAEWKELEDLLLNTEEEWILEIIERKLMGSDGPKWIGGMLASLKCGTRESTSLRIKIYENALKHARNEVGNNRGTGEIVGVLMLHIDAFPPDAVLTLIDQYVEYIQKGEALQGRWVSVLPKLIMNLSQKERLTIAGKEMSGEDYCYQMVKTLCDMNWSVETATSLLPVFRDLDLPKEELQNVIYKVEGVLKKMDYQSVPPIIYHLILLVKSKLPGRILQIVIAYFNKQEQQLMKERANKEGNVNSMELDSETIEESKHSDLTEAQGTVILHITHEAQYYPALVRDFLKFIKSSSWLTERVVTPFNLALSLSLASIEKYEDQILESLKSCILKYYRQEERSRHSKWLREAWGETCHITTAFKATIENCIMGWDQASQGLVHLGFKLLESGGTLKGETYASQKAVSLASVILPLILKKQPHLAAAILSKISNCIVSASSPIQYIEILGKLAKLSPLVLLEHSNLIQEQLEYLVFLPLSAASHLLQALLPLFKMSMGLKDSLMMILRKMLFSKQVESRQAAVKGFMQFLRHFRVMGTLPSSQASMSFSSSLSAISINADVHSVFSNSTNEALCLELLGILRRCFSQQHEVKSVLYSGMYDVCRSNPKMIVSILELLHHQSKQYLDKRPVVFNPIDLRKIVVVQGDSVQLVEPMGDLLSSIGACKLYLEKKRAEGADEDDEEDESAISVLNDICSLFDHVIEKLAGCGLDDIGFDTNGEYLPSTAVGEKNIVCAKVMLSVFDSLIEYSFCQGATTSLERMQTVISLFRSQKKIIDLVKEKSIKPAKKDGKKSRGRNSSKALVNFKGNLRLSVTADMLRASLSNDNENDPACVEMLKGCHDLQMYLLHVIENTLSSIKAMTLSEREKALPHLKTVAKVLLHDCSESIAPEDTSDERHVQRVRQCLLLLSSLINIFCKYYDSKLEAILKEVNDRTDNVDVNRLLYKIYKKCQKMILKILHHEDSTSLLKDACTVLQIMLTVSHYMEPDSEEIIEARSWILQLCKDQELEHGSVAEPMVNLLLYLSDQLKANHTLARGISRELHHKLGHLEEGVSVEEIGKFKIVTEGSSSSILLVLLNYVDDSLSLVELLISKIRACLATEEECNADEVEKSICSKFTVSIHAVHEVIQSALPLGTSTDNTLKVVTKLYNGLSLYVKYYLELYKSKSYPQISDKFERLVLTSGKMLSSPIYSTITYIEGAQKQAGKKKEVTLISRTMKESKLIPSLIYAIEQYEKNLITLSRKSKVNLMEGMELSTSRDFRIMTSALAEALQNTSRNENDEEEEEEAAAGEAEEENLHEENEDQEAENRDSGTSVGGKIKEESSKGVKSKASGPVKKTSKRKGVGDENDGNSQNRLSTPPSKKPKVNKSKLGKKR
ncbi:Fanconi anemia group I protein isoform X1 [Macrobrachium rosenbergii]|uniref:Fanconi anemia group I protein isoform X1 n=2 Tax=Macrobrachium rosenbergii TaxID=79674 RepID=UPI0034D712DA